MRTRFRRVLNLHLKNLLAMKSRHLRRRKTRKRFALRSTKGLRLVRVLRLARVLRINAYYFLKNDFSAVLKIYKLYRYVAIITLRIFLLQTKEADKEKKKEVILKVVLFMGHLKMFLYYL